MKAQQNTSVLLLMASNLLHQQVACGNCSSIYLLVLPPEALLKLHTHTKRERKKERKKK
jgi:hypothetical protein